MRVPVHMQVRFRIQVWTEIRNRSGWCGADACARDSGAGCIQRASRKKLTAGGAGGWRTFGHAQLAAILKGAKLIVATLDGWKIT